MTAMPLMVESEKIISKQLEAAYTSIMTAFANVMKNGINEHYDSISGQPLGVPYLGMTCTIVTMMLDNLSDKYKLSIAKKTR